MEYVYGALLIHSAGKEIDEGKLRKVMEEAGIKADDARLKALVSSLKEVNIEDIIKNASVAQVAQAPAHHEEKAAEKKEEAKDEKPEVSEEDAMAGLSSLFG
ncbi:50S ribosomal protein L12P [mine drainage metagenome]|uniref:50S ribosomal protein L12P n=1 Tax=mine drainage metagenome TaxID=410659 RepID=T1D864_9ZZZZ